MAKTLTVKNASEDRVLVGPVFLLPGEAREVLESHYLAAAGKSKLVVVTGPEATEPDSQPEGEADDNAEADSGRSQTRRRGKGK